MTLQDYDAIRKRLISRGVHLGADFALRHRSKPYVSGKHFLRSINTVFVSYVNKLQDSAELKACAAVLLLDNCSCHISDDVVAVFTRVRVRISTFAPQTTHILQVLDVVLFGALKKHATGLETLD
jgi:hypothetical protein